MRLAPKITAVFLFLGMLFVIYFGDRLILLQTVSDKGLLSSQIFITLFCTTMLTALACVLFIACPFLCMQKRMQDEMLVKLEEKSIQVKKSEERERCIRKEMDGRIITLQRMESLGTLAAGIAHDVNNILTIIQNVLSAQENKTSFNQKELFTTIRQATSKGRILTQELMTYAGNTSVTFKRQNPNEIIHELEQLIDNTVAPNVALEFRLTPHLPDIELDPMQFWKVIINLLKNASEAINGANGHIVLATYAYTFSEEDRSVFLSTRPTHLGEGVVIEIRDSGMGIPKDVRDRIFDPFFSTKAMGRGLGMATVFGIVDAHEGAIAVDSVMGQGTKIRVWLPVSKTQKNQATLQSTKEPEKTEPNSLASSFCALLIDDDPLILKTTSILLRSMHVEAIQAESMRSAVTVFQRNINRIDIVLLDASVGMMDTLQRFMRMREKYQTIPVVIMSGKSEEYIRKTFGPQSYDAYLEKPYTKKELWECIVRFSAKKISA